MKTVFKIALFAMFSTLVLAGTISADDSSGYMVIKEEREQQLPQGLQAIGYSYIIGYVQHFIK